MAVEWYVLRSKSNKELPLWRELGARGFECFYPHVRVQPVNPRSRRIRPYFPGYLFLHTNIEQVGPSYFQWMPFSSGFVSFDGIPATVPESLIHAVRRHVDQINAAGGEQLAGLRPGDVVIVRGGPFDGYEAIFDAQLAGTERVRIFLKFLRDRLLNLELPAGQIEKKTRLPMNARRW